jgi:hypothetical protein
LLERKEDLIQNLKDHGVVVIKRIKLSAENVQLLAENLGQKLIVFPKEMVKEEFSDEKHPGILRLGNIMPDGSKGANRKKGAIWH